MTHAAGCEECGGEMVATGDIATVTELAPDCQIWIYGRDDGSVTIYSHAERQERGSKTPLPVVEAARLSGLTATARDGGGFLLEPIEV